MLSFLEGKIALITQTMTYLPKELFIKVFLKRLESVQKMAIPKEEILFAFKSADRKIHDTIHPNLNDELNGPLLDFRNLSEVTHLIVLGII